MGSKEAVFQIILSNTLLHVGYPVTLTLLSDFTCFADYRDSSALRYASVKYDKNNSYRICPIFLLLDKASLFLQKQFMWQ